MKCKTNVELVKWKKVQTLGITLRTAKSSKMCHLLIGCKFPNSWDICPSLMQGKYVKFLNEVMAVECLSYILSFWSNHHLRSTMSILNKETRESTESVFMNHWSHRDYWMNIIFTHPKEMRDSTDVDIPKKKIIHAVGEGDARLVPLHGARWESVDFNWYTCWKRNPHGQHIMLK